MIAFIKLKFAESRLVLPGIAIIFFLSSNLIKVCGDLKKDPPSLISEGSG
jgi:hypothetical protein